MLLGTGSSFTLAHTGMFNYTRAPKYERGFIKLSARVESLGTALASTTLQAKPVWARGKAKQVPQCI